MAHDVVVLNTCLVGGGFLEGSGFPTVLVSAVSLPTVHSFRKERWKGHERGEGRRRMCMHGKSEKSDQRSHVLSGCMYTGENLLPQSAVIHFFQGLPFSCRLRLWSAPDQVLIFSGPFFLWIVLQRATYTHIYVCIASSFANLA